MIKFTIVIKDVDKRNSRVSAIYEDEEHYIDVIVPKSHDNYYKEKPHLRREYSYRTGIEAVTSKVIRKALEQQRR